ncbi:MAG: hypothetical protein AB7H97_04895 [Pseudobdellovibrionaceae bacterium]
MNFRLLVLSTVFILFGCAHSPNESSSQNFALQVTMEHLSKRDAWKVTFHTSEPTSNLIFDRQINRFRTKTWKPLTPGISVIEKDNQEQIVSASPFQDASFEFDSYYEMTPKDYEFFQAFSDGSVVMYTGHLNACPKDKECKQPVEFSFIPRADERGIVSGSIFTTTYKWTDEAERGTYVYFGNINPIITKFLTAIIDPKLPGWIYKKIDSLLPKLFEHYAKRTSEPLTFKPFVFLNYAADGEGNNSHGGTLPGLIQLSLKGKGWSKPDTESFIDLARFLAHESAHIWNGQLFPYASRDMWMHEGGADAFAYLSLFELNVIDRKRFLDFQSEAFNDCLSTVKNRPLMEVKEDPGYRSHYRCGSMIALLSHSAAQKTNKEHDLFFFWNQLFEATKASGKPYTEEMYFSTLDRVAGDVDLIQSIKYLLRGPITNVKDTYLHEFEKFDVKVEASEADLPRDYNIRIGRSLLRSLMAKDCGGKYGLTSGSNGIETEGIEVCRIFKKPLFVTHINSISIIRKGAKAYDEVKKICSVERQSVNLTIKGTRKILSADCPNELAARENYLKISNVPLKK